MLSVCKKKMLVDDETIYTNYMHITSPREKHTDILEELEIIPKKFD